MWKQASLDDTQVPWMKSIFDAIPKNAVDDATYIAEYDWRSSNQDHLNQYFSEERFMKLQQMVTVRERYVSFY
jgi:hypothetical protein